MDSTSSQDLSQEQIILDAASTVFMRKGYAGARMQEIADEAGINKALLHYYFRSKELLFARIFSRAFRSFWPSIEPVLNSTNGNAREIIRAVVEGYVDLLEQMPYLPNFIISEINRDPAKVAGLIKESGIKPHMVIKAFEAAMDRGELVRMDVRELIIYMIGLCVFPVITKPLLGHLLFSNSDEYKQFMSTRKETLFQFFCRAVCLPPTLEK
jgi:AcrR family transcriptional regulator